MDATLEVPKIAACYQCSECKTWFPELCRWKEPILRRIEEREQRKLDKEQMIIPPEKSGWTE